MKKKNTTCLLSTASISLKDEKKAQKLSLDKKKSVITTKFGLIPKITVSQKEKC
jgi:hypothetical protein